MGSKFGQVRPRTTKLHALERRKKSMFPLVSAVFHPILFILTDNDDMHESSEEFKIRPDPTTECILVFSAFSLFNL